MCVCYVEMLNYEVGKASTCIHVHTHQTMRNILCADHLHYDEKKVRGGREIEQENVCVRMRVVG